MQKVIGNTYPVKDRIKAMGGKWDAANKCWLVPDDRAAEARALVAGAGQSQPRVEMTCTRIATKDIPTGGPTPSRVAGRCYGCRRGPMWLDEDRLCPRCARESAREDGLG